MFYRDSGQPDWTESLLFNDRLAAGLAPLAAVWTGSSWLVGTNIGVFRSERGQSPWTYFDFGLHPTLFASFALYRGIVLTHFANGADTGIEYSTDGGMTWQVLDALPQTFTYNIATIGNVLYGGRVDGLWRRSISGLGAPGPGLHFAIVGPNPIHEATRFRFDLSEPAHVRIDVFDILGRRLPGSIDEELGSGAHEETWTAGKAASGMYVAHFSAAGQSEAVRFVRLR